MSTVDLRSILDEADVAKIRDGYSEDVMMGAARGDLVAVYPPIQGWFDHFFTELYDRELLQPRLRESAILAMMVGRPNAIPLAFHTYWGLAEGLSVEELLRIAMLSGTYTGIDKFNLAAATIYERSGNDDRAYVLRAEAYCWGIKCDAFE